MSANFLDFSQFRNVDQVRVALTAIPPTTKYRTPASLSAPTIASKLESFIGQGNKQPEPEVGGMPERMHRVGGLLRAQ